MKNKIVFLPIIFLLLLLSACAQLSSALSNAEQEFDTGLGLFNRGQYEKAVPHFIKATELESEYTQAYLYLGRSYLNLGRFGEAIQPLRTAYRLAPAETQKEMSSFLLDAILSFGMGELKKGNFKAGIAHLKEGLALDPDSTKVQGELVKGLITYGTTLLAQGKPSAAISSFQEAISIAPANSDAYMGLARGFLQNGNFLQAKDAAESAMRIDPQQKGPQQLLQQLFLLPR